MEEPREKPRSLWLKHRGFHWNLTPSLSRRERLAVYKRRLLNQNVSSINLFVYKMWAITNWIVLRFK